MGPKLLRRNILQFGIYSLIMRKYLRLTLFIIAFLSCSLMLIYQHKYSKLNVILQVMNAFGVKNNTYLSCSRKLQELTRSVRSDWYTVEASAGIPAWTEVFPNVHMYSTFWFGNMSHTLAFVDGLHDIETLECRFFYNNGTSSDYVPASSQLFRKKKNFLFFIIKCKTSSGHDIPHGVSFRLNKSPSIISMQIPRKQSYMGMFSICVQPLPVGFSDIYRTIEFLTFHHHLGVNHFLIYDRGISYSVKKLLLEIAPKSNIFVTLLPWNVPYSYNSASEHGTEYFVDCIHRVMSRNYSAFIINSGIDRFMVTKGVRNLTSLFGDEKFNSEPPRFYERRFCLEYSTDMVAYHLRIPFITLAKDKVHTTELVSSSLYSVQHLRGIQDTSYFKVLLLKGFPQKSFILPKHLAVLHSYQSCNDTFGSLDTNPVVDKYMWKYKNLFYKSKLYVMARQQKLLTEY